MALLDLFSKRQRRARGEVADVYRYNEIPESLRVQIVHILRDALGDDSAGFNSQSERVYAELHEMLAREFGVFQLAGRHDAKENIFEFILREPDIERILDVVELTFRAVELYGSDTSYTYSTRPRQKSADAVDELNARFKEHAVGYQFESGSIVRADSQYIHAEAVRPALGLLSMKSFAGAESEFLSAHEHYRHGKYEDAISQALKALESTLKSICTMRKWKYNSTDTAKQLIDLSVREGLIPAAIQSEFTALRSVLESGVPTIRNKQAGHGTGPTPRRVPGYLAAYTLHLTAASILFLVAAEANMA